VNQAKIAHITTVDVSLRYLLLDQLRSIQQAGYEVVAISSPGSNVPTIEAAGIRHIPVSMTRAISPWADLVSLVRLYQVMRRERFTIVHTHNPKPGLLGQLAARVARVPIVVNTLHGFYFHEHMAPRSRQFYIIMEKIAALCSDRILSQNKEDIQTAIEEGICSPEKIMHLGNGIDVTEFSPQRFTESDVISAKRELGIPPDAPVVGFVGRLAARRKGFLDFLAAGREISKQFPTVRFLIIGNPDAGKPDAVEPSTAADYGIEASCVFLGHRPNKELPKLYLLMNVLVLPSLFEGVPRVVMEASAMKVPAIVTNVKGNREAVEHDRNGLLVPLGDVQALAGAVSELLANQKMAQHMGEEGRRIALERFDQRLVFERVRAEYARLLEQKRILISTPRSYSGRELPGGSMERSKSGAGRTPLEEG
jgi:glycosyltransferase involved in cell wall biosynthesis